MDQTQELLNAEELANRIVSEAAIHRENGDSDLVDRAWEYSNAENAKRNAEQNRAVTIAAGADYPRQLAESCEHDKAKAFSACDAFVKEYEAVRAERREPSEAVLPTPHR
jgi:hypothetical protein